VVGGIAQAAQHLGAEDVAGDADHEQVVRPLAEDQLGRDPGIGAAEQGGIGPLGRGGAIAQQADIAGIERDLQPAVAAGRFQRGEQGGEGLVPGFQPTLGGGAIGRLPPGSAK
jgi:hypothetical protein